MAGTAELLMKYSEYIQVNHLTELHNRGISGQQDPQACKKSESLEPALPAPGGSGHVKKYSCKAEQIEMFKKAPPGNTGYRPPRACLRTKPPREWNHFQQLSDNAVVMVWCGCEVCYKALSYPGAVYTRKQHVR